MAIFTYSPKEVRALELTLTAKLSKNDANRPRTELNRYVTERFEQRKARREKFNRLLEEARAPIVELLKKDKRYVASAAALRKLADEDFKKLRSKRRAHTKHKPDPRLIANSGLTVRVPPYDFRGGDSAGEDAFGNADEKTGTYWLGLVPNFGVAEWVGVAANFVATETKTDPKEHLGVLVDYRYAWRDASAGGTAHNDAATHVWIWGFSENTWVSSWGGGSFDPQWSDGTSGFEVHGSGGDGSVVEGRESLEVCFPTKANSLYQVWVWTDGSCDDGLFSYAGQQISISVPLMVLGGECREPHI
jgi:hypothetical protein